MISEAGARLFAAHADACFAAHPEKAADGAARWLPELWREIDELGFPLALVAEARGGFGASPREALSLVRAAAAHAAPVPLGEAMLANWLLTEAGLQPAEGPAALVSGLRVADGRLTGSAPRAPYGRNARVVVALSESPDGAPVLARVETGWRVDEGCNIAGEARDGLTFDAEAPTTAASPVDGETLAALMAALRAQQIAGAMEAALDLTVAHAREREQFGRPIGRFQAIQQALAVMASHVAAVRAGADMAAEALPLALTAPRDFATIATAAKLRASEGAGAVAAIAHQTHGAIGFTQEYRLHPLTRRLWAWRDEWGSEGFWAERLGAQVAAAGADAFWSDLTSLDEKGEAA